MNIGATRMTEGYELGKGIVLVEKGDLLTIDCGRRLKGGIRDTMPGWAIVWLMIVVPDITRALRQHHYAAAAIGVLIFGYLAILRGWPAEHAVTRFDRALQTVTATGVTNPLADCRMSIRLHSGGYWEIVIARPYLYSWEHKIGRFVNEEGADSALAAVRRFLAGGTARPEAP